MTNDNKPKHSCTCENCNEEYESALPQSSRNKYCSSVCKASANRKITHVCECCGKSFRADRSGAVYCSQKCKGLAASRVAKAKRDERDAAKAARRSAKRDRAAAALRVYRRCGSVAGVAKELGWTDCVAGDVLRSSRYYRRATERRLKGRRWRRSELRKARTSKTHEREVDLQEAVRAELAAGGFSCEMEVTLGRGSRRRCDVVATRGGVVYAVEAKLTNRTSCVDQCIGQAIVSGYALGAVPVCVFPDDCKADLLAAESCAHAGVVMACESSIVDDLGAYESHGVTVREGNVCAETNDDRRAATDKRCRNEGGKHWYKIRDEYNRARAGGERDPHELIRMGYSADVVSVLCGVKKKDLGHVPG